MSFRTIAITSDEIYSEGKRCVSECQRDGEEYTWCQTGATSRFWNYCAPQGKSSSGKDCVGECTFTEYWWCKTNKEDESEWSYCSPPNTVSKDIAELRWSLLFKLQVKKVEYGSNGQECGGECALQGEEYTWCTKAIRFNSKNHRDPYWTHCSTSEAVTR